MQSFQTPMNRRSVRANPSLTNAFQLTNVTVSRPYPQDRDGTVAVNMDNADMSMRVEGITSAPSISHGDSWPQASGQLPLHAPLPATPGPGDSPRQPEHRFMQVGPIAYASDLKAYIIKARNNGQTYFWCHYPSCSHPSHFDSRRQAISHVRSVHLKEKPFRCTCGTYFAHKQDASRHVDTKNRGKIYQCSVCHSWYAREDYRDHHMKRCFMGTNKT
ncbi:hypothetical protein JB92DRAFT_3097489 [Gautieria morchelliformis]|nr:hypothetical protein JB92DRAFT_3097489 [Gautieria morchelliformis]